MGASQSTTNNDNNDTTVEVVIECLDGERCAVRVPATTTLGQLRHVLAAQLDPETVPGHYVFVRSSDSIRIARNQEACLTIADLGGSGKPVVRLHPVQAAGTKRAAADAAADADTKGEKSEQQQHYPKGSPPPPKKSKKEDAPEDDNNISYDKDTKQEEDAVVVDQQKHVASTPTATTYDALRKEGADEKDATTTTSNPRNTAATTTLGSGTTAHESAVEEEDPVAAVDPEMTNYVFVTPAPTKNNRAAAMQPKSNALLLVDTDVGISDALMAFDPSLSSQTTKGADAADAQKYASATIAQSETGHQQKAETANTKGATLIDYVDGADSNATAKTATEKIDSVDATISSADPRDTSTLKDDPRKATVADTAEEMKLASQMESSFDNKQMEENEETEIVTVPKSPTSSSREGPPALEAASPSLSTAPNLEMLLEATDALFEQAADQSNITVMDIVASLIAQFDCLLDDLQKTAVNERFVQLVATKQSLGEPSNIATADDKGMEANDDEREASAQTENGAHDQHFFVDNNNEESPYDDDMTEQVYEPEGSDRKLAAAVTSPRFKDPPSSLGEPIVNDNAMDVDGPEREEEKEKDTAPLKDLPTSSMKDPIVDVGEDEDGSMEVEVVENKVVETALETNRKQDEAVAKSCSVLEQILTMLHHNPDFCSAERRQEWTTEITQLLAKKVPPQAVIGVLGNTGVGKSSLLNALLDEASILPTSGSRGCTAAVVELRFNTDLKQQAIEGGAPVYKGEVEFMSLSEWHTELKVLVEECSTHDDKKIYARTPDNKSQPEAAFAWSKINQVYGHRTMERYHGCSYARVMEILQSNARVSNLLAGNTTDSTTRHTVHIDEGKIDQGEAAKLLKGFEGMGRKLRNASKKWAKNFREKINSYVYRSGTGRDPQTWPLIRKVVLFGPWNVLSTGACLVDLPGVRDANAARAKVAEKYLQQCHRLWIVAPIKRAVDDGTAKELLGQQFKRRLLMDGLYSSISFICSQTDEIEATETMHDHQDVAEKMFLWEKLQHLSGKLSALEGQLNDLQQEEETLKLAHEEAKAMVDEAECELEEASDEDTFRDEDESIDVEHLKQLQENLTEKRKTASEAMTELLKWREGHIAKKQQLSTKTTKYQRRLKAMCARVRNDYSKVCLQEDFRAGIDELVQGTDGEDAGSGCDGSTQLAPIPDDFQMDVFCISANDYLKLQGIKPYTDGPPNTFSKVNETQIPALREFVHMTTAAFRASYCESLADSASNILGQIKLVASDGKDTPSGRMSRRYKASYDDSTLQVDKKVQVIVDEFSDKTRKKVKTTLRPSLATGASNGNAAALQIVSSWRSTQKRSRHNDDKDCRGLHFSTYRATIRRDGVYSSYSAGAIDMNNELLSPVEKAMCTEWQNVMDSSITAFLSTSESQMLELYNSIEASLVTALAHAGVPPDRLHALRSTASRSCTALVRDNFRDIRGFASNIQRDLNRSLLPQIQARMKGGYDRALNVPSGKGVFDRMNAAMLEHTGAAVDTMFTEATQELLRAIDGMIKQITGKMSSTASQLLKTLENIFSILWETQKDKAGFVDPVRQQLVQQCRNSLLPGLAKLAVCQADALRMLGLEREDLDYEVLAVDIEDRFAKDLEKAKKNGLAFDLCDSSSKDDDDELDAKPAAIPSSFPVKVKAEPQQYAIL